MKKSEAFKLGILFNNQAAECFANNSPTGLLTNPNYPPEIQELAKDVFYTISLTEGVAEAEQLICEKLEEEPEEEPVEEKPTDPFCRFCKKPLKNEMVSLKKSKHFDTVYYGPFCNHCAVVLCEVLSVETSIEKEIDE